MHRLTRLQRPLLNQIRNYKIIFCGSDPFSLHSLQKLHKQVKYTKLGVIVPVDAVHESPIRKYCLENNITYSHPADTKKLYLSDFENAKQHAGFGPEPFDILVAVSFRYFIPPEVLNKNHVNIAALNIHPSLLPQYRGAAPIHHAIINGDSETGVSIIELSPEKFDVGNIVEQKRVPIGDEETYTELYHKLGNIGADMLVNILNNLPDSITKSTRQSELVDATKKYKLASKVKHETMEINWNDSAFQIYNKWRALGSLYCHSGGKKLFLNHLSHPKNTVYAFKKPDVEPGKSVIVYYKPHKMLYIRGGDGQYLACSALQWDKKKAMDGYSFGCGIASKGQFTFPLE
jgi:methionyl-tRNA formyltransferase